MAWLGLVALALAVSFTFMNSAYFLHFAIQADTLYPALLAEDLRADWGALLRFRPSRIPSYLPDLAIAVPLDLVTGSLDLLRESGEVPMMREDAHEAAATVYEGI